MAMRSNTRARISTENAGRCYEELLASEKLENVQVPSTRNPEFLVYHLKPGPRFCIVVTSYAADCKTQVTCVLLNGNGTAP
jgi:hypothetical protein